MNSSSLPSISIAIPCKDMNHYIPGLLHNIAGQVVKGDEVLILFDGTAVPDDLSRLIDSYPFVTAFQTSTSSGVSRGRNFLASKAKHDILRFQDADDFLAPYALDNARSAITRLKEWKVLLGGQFFYVDRVFHKLVLNGRESRMAESLMKVNPILVNMCFLHRPTFLEIGGFDPNLEFQEDWDLWLRYLRKFGERGFTKTGYVFGVYNVFQKEREGKQRIHSVDGVPVREYFFKKNGYEFQGTD